MKLNVKVLGNAVPAGLSETVERRLRFSLGRLDNRIQRVDVTLTDVNGPRGGPDQHCTLRVRMPGMPPIVVEVRDFDAVSAVSRAADRSARRVVDVLNRSRDLQRHGATT